MQPTCILCGSDNLFISFTKREYIYKRCRSCGTLFVANHLSVPNVHALYSENYYEAKSLGVNERRGYPSYKEAQKTLKDSFQNKIQLVRERVLSGRLLDAGAAYGTFLQMASPYYECIGLEVSEFAVSVARKEYCVDVQLGSIEDPPFPDKYFDVITMWDIIEHLINPLDALREVYRILKPNGYVFISTDDADNWLPRLLGQYWWAIGPPLHICHFSKRGIKEAFKRTGEFEFIDMLRDKRKYSVPEVIKHFGVSYQNDFLTKIGSSFEETFLKSFIITVTRPEQFTLIMRKIAVS